MELLLKEGSIAKRIKQIKPTHIATAYIGRGWPDYIDSKSLESIVLSPTLGSSCSAIWDLVEAMGGFERIHFLKELHAKFYLSADGAVLGSSNLSDNGLQGEGGLIEAAVAMNWRAHAQQCAELEDMHRKLVARAKKQFPDERAKRKRLEWLKQLQHRTSLVSDFPQIGAPTTKSHSRVRELKNFDPDLMQERIHIAWWSYEMEHNEEALNELLIDKPKRVRHHARDNYISLAAKNDARPGDWILCWQALDDAWEPMVRGKIYWLYVDRVLATTTGKESDDPYVAHEFRKMSADEVPFLLTGKVKKVIHRLLAAGQFPALCNPSRVNGESFDMKAADKQVPAFIKALKHVASRA